MRSFVALLILTLTLSAKCSVDADKEQVLLILKGVIEGIAEEAHISLVSIDACIQDSKLVINDLVTAVALLKSNDASNVAQGIKKIGEAIQVLPDAINECRSSEKGLVEVAHLLTGLLAQLRSPWSFAFKVGKNLLINGVEIYHETETAVNDWDHGDYEDFGRQVGEILYQLLVKQSNAQVQIYIDSKDIAKEVFIGVLIGFGAAGGVNPGDVQQCITDTTTTVNDFIGAVKDFEKNDANSILAGLKLLGLGIQVLPDAIIECKAAEQEAVNLAAKLSAAIAQMSNPKSFAFHIGKDLLVNGKNIYAETKQAVNDWNTENYNDFGQQVGKILYQLFVGTENQIMI